MTFTSLPRMMNPSNSPHQRHWNLPLNPESGISGSREGCGKKLQGVLNQFRPQSHSFGNLFSMPPTHTFLGTPGAAVGLSGQGKCPGNVALRAETASVPGDSARTPVKRHQEVGCRGTMKLFLLWELLSPLPTLLFSLDPARQGLVGPTLLTRVLTGVETQVPKVMEIILFKET